jgi:riboflavin biosynthesis pyrimidine reductase/pyrimidine deaminase RibD-like protein
MSVQVVLSCATSIDGYLDDASPRRLILSNAADFDRVDSLRADADAILVGATTVRVDNPRLRVRSAARRAAREAAGLPPTPLRVTLSRSGNVPDSFVDDNTIVYGDISLPALLADLSARGVRRLLVEGGGSVLTSFLTSGLADELWLAVAPFFVGDSRAPRFVHDGQFPRAVLASVQRLGNVAVHHYLLSESTVDQYWLAEAIELSRRCPPAETAFAVGAVIVDAQGEELARGYSRETDDRVHAEESALAKLPEDANLEGATIYSSLEPCGQRKSRPRTCTDLILAAGIPRVVFAMREPPIFVPGDGAEKLEAAGATVVELPELAEAVRTINAHLHL